MGGSDKLHYLLGTAFLLLALPSCSKQAPPSAVSSLECSAALSFVTDTFEEIRKAPQQDPTGLQFDEAKAEYVDPNSVAWMIYRQTAGSMRGGRTYTYPKSSFLKRSNRRRPMQSHAQLSGST